MPDNEENVEIIAETTLNAELSEEELDKTSGGVSDQHGRHPTPNLLPYIEQDN